MRDRRPIVWLERVLFAIGVTCLICFGLVTVGGALYQREQAAAFEQMRAIVSLPAAPGQVETSVPPASDSLIGMLDVPRLSLSTPIIAGDDRATLEIAAGHLPDTPRPWETGNSAIAAHRDGLFRPLKNIRVGDRVIVRTVRGDLEYRVRDTKIVRPDDLSVLAPTETQTLTLITCYPFGYIGNAPKRFVVHADRVTAPAADAAVTVAAFNPVPAERKVSKAPERKISKTVSKRSKAKRKVLKPTAEVTKATTADVMQATSTPKSSSTAKNFFKKIGGFFKGKKRPER